MSPRSTRFFSTTSVIIFLIVGFFLFSLAVSPQSAVAQSLAKKGSLGATLGLMRMTSDSDVKVQSALRGMGDLRFMYFFSDRFAFTTTAGFGWTGYPTSMNQIATQLPLVFGVELRPFGKKPHAGSVVPKIGFGAGFYSWVLETKAGRNVKKDPQTKAPLRASDPGGFGEFGIEYFAAPSVGITGGVLYHYIKSEDLVKYPTAFGANDAFVQFKAGVNYYFSMDRIKRKPSAQQ